MHTLLLSLTTLTACEAPGERTDVVLYPASGGYTVEVEWEGAAPGAVTLGGVTAFVQDTHSSGFTLEVQGAPAPGPVALVFDADGERIEVPDAFTYEPPIDPVFDRMVGFGASIGAGFQSGGLTATMAQQSSVAVLARLAGAYLGLPQVADGLFLPLGTDTVGPGCDLPGYDDHVTESFLGAIELMNEDGAVDWARGRRDPAIEVRNFGIPGAGLEEQAYGPRSSDVGGLFFGHLFLEPEGALTAPLARSELDHTLAAEPTIVVGVDILGNDVLDAILGEDGLDLSLIRPLEQTQPALDSVVDGLASIDGWVFLADLPRPSVLPVAAEAARSSRAAGVPEEEITAMLAEIDAAALAYNETMREAAARHDNVVIVPLAAAAEELAADGVAIDGTLVTTRPLGGLVSLDGVHFTATGNAVLANIVADSIDATLGTSLPRADLAAVLAADPASPEALAAAGLDSTACP